MHTTIIDKNNNRYIVRLSDIRRVISNPDGGCIIYFNNKVDTPISVNDLLEHFHDQFLLGTFLLIEDKNKKQYSVRKKSIRRVHTTMNGDTMVCFATKKDTSITLNISVKDFEIVYLGENNARKN